MRKVSPLEAALTSLRLSTWNERLGWALAAVLLLAALLALIARGENVGAHIWQSGWSCGESLKGAIGCNPDRAHPAP